jgi:hypothetical protein
LKPEEEARKKIDELLEKAGWQKYDKATFSGVQMELLSKTKTVRWVDKTIDDKEKTNEVGLYLLGKEKSRKIFLLPKIRRKI